MGDKEIAERKIQEVTAKIVKNFDPEKIILFGSWAWGRPDPDSDVDLLIIKDTDKPNREVRRELRMKLFPPGLPLDIIIYTPKEIDRSLKMGDYFIREILNKGKILYGSPQ